MRFSIKVKYIAAVTVKKTHYEFNRYKGGKGCVDIRFTNVLAGVETKKWPWSKTVTDCEVFVHNSLWETWRHADTLDRVRKPMAVRLTDSLRSYMAGHGDGKDAK